MRSKIRRFGACSNILAILALVFAMSGGAYAAGKFLITSTKQISPKVLKSLKGTSGKNGAPGATGPVGPAGAKGNEGPTGKAGATGAQGSQGLQGPEGPEGPAGQAGTKGEPWTPNNTLPAGASEKGTWAVNINAAPTTYALSFPIPLATELEAANVHVIKHGEGEGEGEEGAAIKAGECKGTVAGPQARSGDLCVFLNNETGVNEAIIANPQNLQPGAATVGTLLIPQAEEVKGQIAFGTWAVTAG